MTRIGHSSGRGTKGKSAVRRPTNLSLDARLIDEAKRLGLNILRACERGLSAQIGEERARRWRSENAEAIASSNAWVEKNGLPLAKFRQFRWRSSTSMRIARWPDS